MLLTRARYNPPLGRTDCRADLMAEWAYADFIVEYITGPHARVIIIIQTVMSEIKLILMAKPFENIMTVPTSKVGNSTTL